eukprot:403357787
MEMTKQRTQAADGNMGNQPFGGTIMEVPKPAQNIPPPGLQPQQLHLWQEEQQQKHIQSQQSAKQQELFKQQQQYLKIENVKELKQKQDSSDEVIQDILKGIEVSTMSMQLKNAPNRILAKLMSDETQKIESQFNVKIKIDKDNYIVSGNDQGIAHAFIELSIIEQKLFPK